MDSSDFRVDSPLYQAYRARVYQSPYLTPYPLHGKPPDLWVHRDFQVGSHSAFASPLVRVASVLEPAAVAARVVPAAAAVPPSAPDLPSLEVHVGYPPSVPELVGVVQARLQVVPLQYSPYSLAPAADPLVSVPMYLKLPADSGQRLGNCAIARRVVQSPYHRQFVPQRDVLSHPPHFGLPPDCLE